MLKKLFFYFIIFFTCTISAQLNEEVLFTINDDKVYTSEFLSIYKKNQDIIVDQDNKSFQDYLDLFVEYKLKVKKAFDLKLDTLSTYQAEVEAYKGQLLESFLANPEATDKLAHEAYERTLNEVNASHILIRSSPNDLPKDTLKAYQRIEDIRHKILNGLTFEEAAAMYSEDPSAKANQGNLGYFSAFDMVYSFENIAFNTPVGKTSKPFRSQFGFHIIKVNDKRVSKGEVEVGHIMIKHDSTNIDLAYQKIQDIYKKLNQGDNFSKIAQQHSDDLSSAQKGGVLPKFGTGKVIKPFEDVAFSLKEEGDFSKPFSTNYGWHILKLIKKYPVESFEELEAALKQKIKNSNRSKYINLDLAKQLEKQYNVKENLSALSLFYTANSNIKTSNDTILSIDNEIFTTHQFYNFYINNKDLGVGGNYDVFKAEQLINYHKQQLSKHNQNLLKSIKEYQEGLLLFEFLQSQIWQKAETDSIGLIKYFNENRNQYIWKERADITMASCTQLDKAKQVKTMLENGLSVNEIEHKLNDNTTIHVLFSSGKVEPTHSKLPKDYQFSLGVSKIFNESDHNFIVIKTDRIYEASQKALDECKGLVINDYQNFLEAQLVDQLKDNYRVKMNKKAVKKLKHGFKEEQ